MFAVDSGTNHFLGEAELLDLLRERLGAGQTIRFLPFRGTSMLPLLRQGRDSVQLSPLPDVLKPYDLPVYQYPSGKIVMHRIVKAEKDHCVCLGDNTYRYEHITRDMMLGIVTAIRRGDRVIPVEARGYRLYCFAWCTLFPLRRLIWRGKNWLRRWLK